MLSQEIKLFAGEIKANGNTKTTFLDVEGFKGGLFFIKCSAASGTNPTLDVKVIAYDKKTADWYTLVTFTQLTTTGKEMKTCADVGQRIAIEYTIAGTNTPSFTFIVSAILKNA